MRAECEWNVSKGATYLDKLAAYEKIERACDALEEDT